MCICCGAAVGMVLSSWPIFVLIPLISWRVRNARSGRFSIAARRTGAGIIVAMCVYLVTNPYLLINAFINRDVLRSNFSNSLAMYQLTRIGEGFVRVLELTLEGATLPILVFGLIALIIVLIRKNRSVIPLAVPAAVFFLQFVLIGAGKPAEYGRFGIFTNTALAIGASCLLARRWTGLREIVNWIPASFVVIWVGLFGAMYLSNFQLDATSSGSRINLAEHLRDIPPGSLVGVTADPGPYCCPPLNFSNMELLLVRNAGQLAGLSGPERAFIRPVDRQEVVRRLVCAWTEDPQDPWAHRWRMTAETPISWANKPFDLFVYDRPETEGFDPRR